MSSSPYEKLNVLVVDDFNSFRMSLNRIMHDLGFGLVDSVATGEQALHLCKKTHYDLILCDYNLGRGKNGQQILEELRHDNLLMPEDTFVLLSAETSRNVVMSAYDFEPDAYLTKPITTKVIEQRLKRLLNKRGEMLEVYSSLKKNDASQAIKLLEDKLREDSRYSMECQKLLTELYFKTNQLDKAETIFRTVLEMRALDWAQVGLAKVKVAKGEPAKAVEWLNDIIKANPSCMKAYDALSIALQELDDSEELQKNFQKAVEMSPMSLGRQLSLANTAMENGDAEVAAQAYRKILKYGANSCHNTIDNNLNFAKAVSKFYDNDATRAGEMAQEALKILNAIEEKLEIDSEEKIKSQLLTGQLLGLKGDSKKSQTILDAVTDYLTVQESVSIEIEIEVINTLIANSNHDLAYKKTQALIEKHKNNESALEKIDPLLPEPVSEKGKKILREANKNGIDAYTAKEYDTAIKCFAKVERRYPRYLGVKLNLVQALIGKMRDTGMDEGGEEKCLGIFNIVKRYVPAGSPQFNRYRQLQEMFQTLIAKNSRKSNAQ